jgi:hypothetical protein
MNLGCLALAILVAANAVAVGAQDLVEIRVRRRFYTEPATVRITVAVRPDQENRTLVILADGDRFFRSSEVTLEGDKEQRIHTVEFKNLPAGHYVLRAEVHSHARMRAAAEESLTVGEPGDAR